MPVLCSHLLGVLVSVELEATSRGETSEDYIIVTVRCVVMLRAHASLALGVCGFGMVRGVVSKLFMFSAGTSRGYFGAVGGVLLVAS